MATIGELVVNLLTNTSSFHSGLDRAERRSASFGGNVQGGFRKAENAIVDLGLKVLGLDGKLGKLAEGALIFGVGGAWTVALTAGLAIGGAAWRAFAKDTELGVKAQGKSVSDLAKDFDDAIKKTNPELQYRGMLQAITQRSNDLNATIDSLTKVADNADNMPGARAEAGANIGKARGELMELGKAAFVAGTNYNALLAAMAKPVPSGKDAGANTLDTLEWLHKQALASKDAERIAKSGRAVMDYLENRALGPLSNTKSPNAFEAAARGAAQRKAVQDQLAGINQDIIKSVEQTASTIDVKLSPFFDRQVKMAAFVEEVWKSAARNIQTALADGFETFFKGQLRSAEDFVLAIIGVWQRALAEIAAAQVAQGLAPIVSGILGGTASGPGGDTSLPGSAPATINHFHINAMDAQSFRQFARRNSGALVETVVRGAQQSSGFGLGVAGA